jgi:maltooligosyltrehalose trehalohydrolase
VNENNQLTRPSGLGATPLPGGGCEFVVWAPNRNAVQLLLKPQGQPRVVPMTRGELGYYRVIVDGVAPGTRYTYGLDGSQDRPDPASRHQPDGVHGPSEVVDVSAFAWTDADWKGRGLCDSVFYELHVGAYTPEGTFAALIPHLAQLKDLGVTTVELMPVAQFSGGRNWGYDGVYPFAPQNTYGAPRELQNLVNAAHAQGLAVALDVVYNHLGPEGNYLGEYAPYFTDHYRTPWGAALNFDRAHSDEVRFFFIQNALYWLREFHFDALRLDAVHSIFDASAYPFLAELSAEVTALSSHLGRQFHLIAESDLNDIRVLRPTRGGGFAMHAQWSDDFHHAVHTLLTGESSGYYADFGGTHPLKKTLENGWYYSGQYSRHRERRHGNGSEGFATERFVVCNQNHDQVGNRAKGDRLSALVDFEGLKLAAGITVLSSFVPMLFMGEEYGEVAPFQYFTSHLDKDLGEAVRRGREGEFAAFGWKGGIPDPQSESTFAASKLNHSLVAREPHGTLRRFYQMLLRYRRDRQISRPEQTVVMEYAAENAMVVRHQADRHSIAALFHFGQAPTTLPLALTVGTWTVAIDSADAAWRGKGASSVPRTFDAATVTQVSMQPRSFLILESPKRSSGG